MADDGVEIVSIHVVLLGNSLLHNMLCINVMFCSHSIDMSLLWLSFAYNISCISHAVENRRVKSDLLPFCIAFKIRSKALRYSEHLFVSFPSTLRTLSTIALIRSTGNDGKM